MARSVMTTFLVPTLLVFACLSRGAEARALLDYHMGPSGGGCTAAQKAELAAAATLDEYPAEGSEELIVWGTALNYSGGEVRTYTKYAAASDGSPSCETGPSAVGVEVDDSVLSSLPGPADVSVQPPPVCATDPSTPGCFTPFDQLWLNWLEGDLSSLNPFPVMELNWEPVGHALENVYSVPHFDFHFYLVPEAAVMNITAGPCLGLSPEAFYAANQPIPEACFPGGKWANMMAVAPYMGNHFLSADAPEIKAAFAGQNGVAAWNATWIWGGYDGQVTYMEPMIKRSYLMSKPDECWSIPDSPKEWAIAGYKPSTYCVTSTDTGVRVELRDFTWFDAGCMGDQPIANASLPMPNPEAPPLPPECELPMA